MVGMGGERLWKDGNWLPLLSSKVRHVECNTSSSPDFFESLSISRCTQNGALIPKKSSKIEFAQSFKKLLRIVFAVQHRQSIEEVSGNINVKCIYDADILRKLVGPNCVSAKA